MKRPTVNLMIDALAATLVFGMVATGYILSFALPPGTNKSLWLWGMTRHQWGQIHLWISLALLLALLLHIALHWKWIVAVIVQRVGIEWSPQTRHRRVGAISLLALATIVALFALMTRLSVRELDCRSLKSDAYASCAAPIILRFAAETI